MTGGQCERTVHQSTVTVLGHSFSIHKMNINMNIYKHIKIACLFIVALGVTPVWAQTMDQEIMDTVLTHCEQNNPQSGYAVDVTNFVSIPACYVGGHNMFVVIDSIDNSVDIIMRPGMDTVRYFTDVAVGRHDLGNILRPKSVGFYDGYAIILASAKKDSSFLAVFDIASDSVVCRVDFNCCSYAFQIFPDEIILVGRNQLGYDINILDMQNGIANLSTEASHCQRYHYHKPKQADRIRESDPIGIGLTVTAVAVVFLALLCISLILKGYGKLIVKTQDRKAQRSNAKEGQREGFITSASETSGEIYAAIAAAIYMYDEELHDEEDTVITIQKVERAWTPWNAKYYNMNHYFNNKK